MGSLTQDVRFALRQLVRHPGFTLVSLTILAIGIGANTAIFSVIDSVLIRPLPFERPEELVQIRMTNPESAAERRLSYAEFGVNVLDYEEYRARAPGFTDMGFLTPYDDDGRILVDGGQGAPEEVWAWGVSSSLFGTLGVQPMLGRVFLEEERAPPGDMRYTEVAILSHRLWQRRFGADPDIVGRTITLENGSSTVVGVMPAGFDVPPISMNGRVVHRRADVYLPMYYEAYQQPRRFRQVSVIGRLAPGATAESAQAGLSQITDGLREAYPEDLAGWSAVVVPLHAALEQSYGSSLYLLMGAVGLVLLIACGNLASLLTVRATTRTGELAIRLALGSGRGRLVRLLMTETMLLALLGGAAGVLLALWGTGALVELIPADVPRVVQRGLDARILGFALGLTLLTGILFGALPALRASRGSTAEALKTGVAGRSGGRGLGTGVRVLVAGQVATAVVLLIGAGLLSKSFLRLQGADPGYDARNVLVANVTFGTHHLLTQYAGNAADRTPERLLARSEALFRYTYHAIEELERLPGVEVVASGSRPLSGSSGQWPLLLEGSPEPRAYTLVSGVTPDYFRTMGIPLLRGEAFSAWDGVNDRERYQRTWTGGCEAAEQYCVAIVSETLARTVWPGEDPIGKRIGIYDCCLTVIGVVGDARHRGADDPPLFWEFDPAFHVYHPFAGSTFLVRAATDPVVLIEPVRRVLAGLEPEGLVNMSTLEDDISASLARPRFYMALFGLFALVAVGLAMVGLYGVISHAVAQRTREIGLRLALGAERVDVLSLVVRQGAGPLLLGIVIGLAGAAVLSRVLTGVLYGMEPLDPPVYGVLAAMVSGVGLLSSYLPARRASRVSPMQALRHD